LVVLLAGDRLMRSWLAIGSRCYARPVAFIGASQYCRQAIESKQ
jgi:hypothetical protein